MSVPRVADRTCALIARRRDIFPGSVLSLGLPGADVEAEEALHVVVQVVAEADVLSVVRRVTSLESALTPARVVAVVVELVSSVAKKGTSAGSALRAELTSALTVRARDTSQEIVPKAAEAAVGAEAVEGAVTADAVEVGDVADSAEAEVAGLASRLTNANLSEMMMSKPVRARAAFQILHSVLQIIFRNQTIKILSQSFNVIQICISENCSPSC